MQNQLTFKQIIWKQFSHYRLGLFSLGIVCLFILAGIYAPLLASSKPLIVQYNGEWFLPLFRYLFYPGFFSKRLDIFFNLLMFTFPVFIGGYYFLKNSSKTRWWFCISVALLQIVLFLFLIFFPPNNPAALKKKELKLMNLNGKSWEEELKGLNSYAKLNLVLRFQQYQQQHERIKGHEKDYLNQAVKRDQTNALFPSLWNLTYQPIINRINLSVEKSDYLKAKIQWLKEQQSLLKYEVMPLIRPFHWEDDAGGDQALNHYVSWWDITRPNRKDMVASLIFGIRISLSVGLLAIALALLIGVPIGAISGYYGGKIDLILYRFIEIWESMPTFFMLLMIVAFFQSKSIFLVIGIIGLFGWTGFSRFVRGEFFKQKQLLYVEACRAMGYGNGRIMFSHLL
ncbi:MAG: ABC transporter permease subunit, partial [Parachlamydiaceae bacterium]|nr:ABC transporter permease subunit [Parachlamydiaceae bacterium]